MMRVAVIICSGALLVSGCSDPKKASNANFAKAIDAYLAKKPLCINAPTSDTKPVGHEKDTEPYPAYVQIPTKSYAQSGYQMQIKPFDVLAKAGLLSAKTGTITYHDNWVYAATANPKIAVRIYDLTDTGRKALTKSTDAGLSGNRFCYGTAQVDEVTQFTEPSPAFGATISSVQYIYHVKDQASWASDPAVQEAVMGLKQATGDKLHGRTDLVLTNNGWVDSRDKM